MSALSHFANEEKTVYRARCSWCSNSTDNLKGRKDFYDVSLEYAGIVEKGRVCSPECGAGWREWAKNRVEQINKAFPII